MGDHGLPDGTGSNSIGVNNSCRSSMGGSTNSSLAVSGNNTRLVKHSSNFQQYDKTAKTGLAATQRQQQADS